MHLGREWSPGEVHELPLMLLEESFQRRIWGHYTGHTLGERGGMASFSSIVQIVQEANQDCSKNSQCEVCK